MAPSPTFGQYLRGFLLLLFLLSAAPVNVSAQEIVNLPVIGAASGPTAQRFTFVTDGPPALSWGRPPELPRT